MQSRERKTIARPAHFGRKSIGKVPGLDFLFSAVLLGAVGLIADRKMPLVLCMLCAGLTFLSYSLQNIVDGRVTERPGWRRYTIDAREEPTLFGFTMLFNLALAAFLIGYAILVLIGVVDLSMDDARHFARFWERRRH